jgi:hypothetical protein
MSTVCVPLEEESGTLGEIFALIYRLLTSITLAGVSSGKGSVLEASTMRTANPNCKFGSCLFLPVFGVGMAELQTSFMEDGRLLAGL